jgi:hypothetical protein
MFKGHLLSRKGNMPPSGNERKEIRINSATLHWERERDALSGRRKARHGDALFPPVLAVAAKTPTTVRQFWRGV